MSPEVIIAAVAVLGLVGGLVTWLLHTGGSVTKALVELGICKSDVSKLQTETQQLRDSKVEHSATLRKIEEEQAKTNIQLGKIDTLIASVAALTAIVERLERHQP